MADREKMARNSPQLHNVRHRKKRLDAVHRQRPMHYWVDFQEALYSLVRSKLVLAL